MIYIIISFSFFTTRASQPCKKIKKIHTHVHRQRLNLSFVQLNIGRVVKQKTALLLGRDIQVGQGILCSYPCCFCSSLSELCCLWIPHTSVCTASRSSCECHNTEAVGLNRVETSGRLVATPQRFTRQNQLDTLTCLWT